MQLINNDDCNSTIYSQCSNVNDCQLFTTAFGNSNGVFLICENGYDFNFINNNQHYNNTNS